MRLYIKMKHQISESIEIPEGIECQYENKILKCKKNSAELSRKIDLPKIKIEIKNNSISFSSKKAGRNEAKETKSLIAHMKNLFAGLNERFTYKLEACNVHFPMNLKLDNDYLVITNFLGESTPRKAKILQNVEVKIKGHEITVSSSDLELAGQTASNIEKATKIKNRDRRVFQDGIYIVERPEKKK